MQSLLLLANPAASGFTGGLHRDVVATLRSAYEVEAAWPQSPEDARAHAAAAVVGGVDMVVALGGDGVVHHVANGLLGSPTALGIIPAGTTNVVARILGLPSKPMQAAKLLADQPQVGTVPIADLVTSPVSGASDKRVALFAIGTGIDAEVVAVAEQEPYRKYSFGSVHYARTALGVLWREFRHRAPNMRIEAPGRSADAVAAFIQIHDMYTYFGRVPLRLGGHVPDTLTVLVVKELPPTTALHVVARALMGGDADRVENCELWTGVDVLSISAEPPVAVQADGELLGHMTETRVTVAPEALLVARTGLTRRRAIGSRRVGARRTLVLPTAPRRARPPAHLARGDPVSTACRCAAPLRL